MLLWLVGKTTKECEHGMIWEFFGVFDDRRKAEAEARRIGGFIALVRVNEVAPDETRSFPDAYFPSTSES